MRLKIEKKVPEGWSELRFCITNESGEIVCHRDKLTDLEAMLAAVEEMSEDEPFTPSYAVREGFRWNHYQRVLEAREYHDRAA